MTWRQFRAQAITAGCVLAVLAAASVAVGAGLASLYSSSGLAACHGARACQKDASYFSASAGPYVLAFIASIGLVYLAPALIGMFWGAPLVAREIEAGTLRVAWNQSVTRNRWLVVKLGLVGLAAMATAGLLSLATGWWSGPLYRAQLFAGSGGTYRLMPVLFGAQGIVPLGYAAFAFALGVTAGLLIRRTIPAMAVTLAVFALVQVAWPTWVRPHLLTPLRESVPFSPSRIIFMRIGDSPGGAHPMLVTDAVEKPGAWVLSNQTVDAAGHVFTGPATSACMGNMRQCNAWLAAKHLRQVLTYQPASRFWAFQWEEMAIFLVLALALAGLCAWRTGRRRKA